ncbi:MAG: GGDEF domain-containing protein, partial [Halanaerobium sp.]|nr:GGDEF domain-containing protein [Halanaerobium sp.]
IDNFKDVNDTYGHLIGDEFLKEVASSLKDNLRKSDRLFRFGGEEFLIILPATDKVQALKIAERLRETISDICIETAESEAIHITVSLGISNLKFDEPKDEIVDDGSLQYELVRQADNALYLAKQRGKNRVEVYSS